MRTLTTIDPAPETPEIREGEELLKVTGLVKHFAIRRGLLQRQVGAVQAVDGLDFMVRKGETLSLVGESGCGKTTTGRLLTRLEEPTAGEIIFEGHDITHMSEGRCGRYGARADDLPGPVPVVEPAAHRRQDRRRPVPAAERQDQGGTKKAVQALLELVGLSPEHYNRYPHEFSGGSGSGSGSRGPSRCGRS